MTNYQLMEMRFNPTNDKKVFLRGMSNGGPNIVSTKRREAFFRYTDVSFERKCLITIQKSTKEQQHHLVEIQSLLCKHDCVFGEITLGRPRDKGFEHTIEF
jgi:hypothetical protein